MKAEDRQLLYDALMHGSPEHPVILAEFADCVNADLDAIEPLIDQMLRTAKTEGVAAAIGAGKVGSLQETPTSVIVVPDGFETVIVMAELGPARYAFHVDRSRLRDFCKYLIEESEKGA